jgi:DNA-binding transcriptional ArsR family regulator
MRFASRPQYSSDFLSLLSNPRRRRIIAVLHEVGGEACVREVVRRVAEMEKGAPSDWRSRKSVYTGIIQNHLPRMSRAGIIEYDKEKDILRLLPKGKHYYLETTEKGDIPWSVYYLVMSFVQVISGLILAAYTHLWALGIFVAASWVVVLIPALIHTARTYGVSGIELIPMGIWAITKRFKRLKNARRKPERHDS